MQYWINKINHRCKTCGHIFDLHTPNGYDGVVKFTEVNGVEIRWLPMYGQGGYLDLFEKFMPEFLATERVITPAIALQFINKLQAHIEPSEAGNGFEISQGKAYCPRCNKQEIEILSEEVLTSPEITWLKIDCALLKK
jgi:rubredoxin